MPETQKSYFPRNITLPDGGDIELKIMGREDRDAMLAFARALPPEDLMFLRIDLTQDAAVDTWIRDIEADLKTAIVAYDNSGLQGYAAVSRNPVSWTRHVGEIRVNVSPSYRSRGLGRALTSHIFDIARGLALTKLTAQMTTDQPGAQAAFRRLGFVPEAVLADYVQDRSGVTRDMVIMSYDIDGHTDMAAEVLKL